MSIKLSDAEKKAVKHLKKAQRLQNRIRYLYEEEDILLGRVLNAECLAIACEEQAKEEIQKAWQIRDEIEASEKTDL